MKQIPINVIFISLLLAVLAILVYKPAKFVSYDVPSAKIITMTIAPTQITPKPTLLQYIKQAVPFTSQAPNSDWSDPRLQDGCEEAAVLMAYYWSVGKSLSPETSLNQLFAMADYETQNYGDYRDTSLSDTATRLFTGYFKYENYKYLENVTLDQIISELLAGHVVIAPMDGKLLHNPYYTAGGPDRHMLLLIGYDFHSHEFITNDAGTRRGEGYRYSENVLYTAIRDYSTGYHIPIPSVQKNILVVYKNLSL